MKLHSIVSIPIQEGSIFTCIFLYSYQMINDHCKKGNHIKKQTQARMIS